MDSIKRTTVRSMQLSRRHGTRSSSSSDPFYHLTQGSLHLSTHHIIFEKDATSSGNSVSEKGNEEGESIERGGEKEENELWIPLSLLHSVTKSPPTFTGAPTPVVLRTRDFYTYSLSFPTAQEVDEVFESLKNLCSAFSNGGLENRWAFFCHKQQESKGKQRVNGWEVYDPKKEFARMGVGSRSKAWRFSDINLDFNFCPSYPAQIVVPARISDTTLSYAVKYRSKCRIPGLVYLHWANYGSITRSSQPMVGITQTARSIQDEKLIEAIFSSHSQHSGSREAFTLQSPSSTDSFDPASGGIVYGAQATNVIIDARPTKNAYANSVKGAGTENMTFYKNCKKEYLGIDNIHVMRSSLNGVFQALTEAETTGHLDRLALRRTNWLSHLTNILDGVLIVIRTIHLSNSHVLVHCSDGWDRTSQLSALPQICLDPFYRTARGLAVLIEKDWIAYGHKFTDRSGHLCNDRIEFNQRLPQDATTQQSFLASVQKQFAGSSHQYKETCPVFQQFLDCIYQIMRQFPDRFEWNEELLRKLVWETYSGKSGSFLFNSEAERTSYKARERTTSVWEEIFDLKEEDGSLKLKEQYRNHLYDPSLDDPESKIITADQGVLLFDPQNVKYWYELFGRTDEEMNPPKPVMSPQSEERALTEHQVVTSEEDDPVLHPLCAATSGLSLTSPPSSSSSLQPSSSAQHHSRSASPSPRTNGANSTATTTTEQQLSETVASVQKFGWSAWKTVQKLGAEAAKQYKERTVQEQQQEQENGWSQGGGEYQGSVGGGGGGSGRSEGSGSSGMWSRFSTISSNPWGTTTEDSQPQPQTRSPLPDFSSPSSSSSSAQTPTASAYTPYQPRKPSAPHPIRQPSSALSINPWETIDREDALPTPLPRSEEPRTATRTEEKKKEEEIKSYGADPLGVL